MDKTENSNKFSIFFWMQHIVKCRNKLSFVEVTDGVEQGGTHSHSEDRTFGVSLFNFFIISIKPDLTLNNLENKKERVCVQIMGNCHLIG